MASVMPEGHTIHRVAQDHRKRFLQQTLYVSSPQGRFDDEADQLDQLKIAALDAHGKHLFYHWSDGAIMHIHLGLYGRFRNHRCPPPAPRGAVRCRIVGAEHAFDLIGPTACELLTPDQHNALRARLGADPLRGDADVERLWQRISRSRAAIGKLLLDQSVIAGVGNVYRAEALFALRIHPERAGRSLSQEQFDELWDWLTAHLKIGVRHNRIITAPPERIGKPRSRMNRDERVMCYKKENCPECGTPIQSWDLGARKIYACPRCQQ